MSAVPVWAYVLVGLAVVGVVLLAGWCSWTAGRLDRMHLRVEAARASLHAQLQRRASVAGELAAGGLGDPASALVLLEAARTAREAGGLTGHWHVESDLTAAVHMIAVPDGDPLGIELTEATRSVHLSRRIYNDLAARAVALHRRRRVRWFRLAGHAAVPPMIEFDDRPL